MKTILLISLTSLLLSSCSQKNNPSTSTYKNRVVLGAFNDAVSTPSLRVEALEGLPRIVDLKADMSPIKNQGSRGTCTFFSTMGLVEAAIKKDLKKEVNLSEEYLNYTAKTSGYFPRVEGSTVSSNLYSISNYGLLLERDWSYQPSWFGSKLPCEGLKAEDMSSPLNCFSHNAPDEETKKKIIPAQGLSYTYVYKDTTEIIRHLAEKQRPLTMSIAVNFNGWPNTGDVYHNEELRQECLQTPSPCGGHSILLTGYDLDKKVFFFKNSWGKEWGHEGFGTITFDTVENYVTDSLYYATATEELSIPADYDKDYLEFVDFDLLATQNDGSNLKLATTGTVNNMRGRTLYVSSFLSQKQLYIVEPPTDSNTISVELQSEDGIPNETYARGYQYFFPNNVDTIAWTPETPLMIDFPLNILKTPTVSALLGSTEIEALARTTIYVHTDDATFKVLKRIYHPIK